MCGRYASTVPAEDLAEELGAHPPPPERALPPNWNVAPTDPVYAVLTRRSRDGGDPVRRLRVVRWGLVPSWAKDTRIGSRLINARSETLADKPAFRKAYAARRCLLPADGYYEWRVAERPDGPTYKQPWFIARPDGRRLAMAGLYEVWRDPARADDDPDALLWTATVITTTAADDLGHLHDRMPMSVEPSDWAVWLDPDLHDTAGLADLLVPAAPGLLTAHPVSTAVNDVRHDGPELVRPLREGSAPTLF